MGCERAFPWGAHGDVPEGGEGFGGTGAEVEVTEAVREWDYGEFEGVTSEEIRRGREERGEGEWDIWRDGCPGGEYVVAVF